MKNTMLALRGGWTLTAVVMATATATAATSFSNTLRGFTGNSTQAATRAALAAAGFEVDVITGAGNGPPPDLVPIDPTVLFDAQGATFGGLLPADGGRNYIRTIQSDYATTSFTSEITIVTLDMETQDVYFGLGAGVTVPTAFFTPDWTTQTSSVMYWGESENIGLADPPPTLDVFRTQNNVGLDVYTPIPDLPFDGTHRLRIDFDRYARTFTLGFDVNYNGTFAADVTTPPMDVSSLYGPTGWNSEPSRIFFGGDDAIIIKDFQVTTTGAAAKDGDFTGDGLITSADWVILRNNLHKDISSGTHQQAYFLGDLTGDKKNDHADFVRFKAYFDAANGVGAFTAMLASVPEPSSLALTAAAGLALLAAARSKRD
ncbi:MAG: hypothetical protein DCC67_09000 [Planctomycetota bacterium]|nr:MAG: hypothetical protein DCC67_09000 [Planctomycetota bacterium]